VGAVRVLLISANTETMNMPTLPLGPASVAAATESAGHDVFLLDLMFQPDAQSAATDAVRDFRPQAIGVSVRNIDDQAMANPHFLLPPVREIVAACRGVSNAPIILGGAGYSIFPESALRYLGADMGIQGEGEAAFPALLERIGGGADVSDLTGICLPGRPAQARRFTRDLDDLPLPEPRLWIPAGAGRGDLWVPVQSRRGCPMDCTFCSTSLIEGRSVRRRSPARVVRWLAALNDAGCRNFNFVDNTFNLPPSYAKELCSRIIEAGLEITFWAIIYPQWVDAELAQLMSRAGCRQVSLGFESGSDRILRGLNKRFSRQGVQAASKLFQEAGMARWGFLLLGAPGETRDTVEESLAFADSLKLEALNVTAGIRIYPHTPLARTALAEGVTERDADLLSPCFYLAAGLREWLPERVAAYKASRPWVN
jgi:radical SAM superfamily enzyme YgiQ (UPF0313 family)